MLRVVSLKQNWGEDLTRWCPGFALPHGLTWATTLQLPTAPAIVYPRDKCPQWCVHRVEKTGSLPDGKSIKTVIMRAAAEITLYSRNKVSMSKKTKAFVLTLSFAIALFTVIGGLGVRAASNEGAYKQLGVYGEVLSRIRTEYVEEPNIPRVTDGALHGLLESLDANSSYLTPEEYRKFKQRKADGKGLIGAAVSKRFGYAAVISVIPGGPADKAGVENGDIIEAIEGRTTREMSLAEVNNMLQGEPGSNVNFSIVRARRSEPQKITITRNVVTIPPVSEKTLEDGIGYLKVDALSKGKAQEIAGKLKALQNKGIKRVILDLRDCSSGEESEGIATANLFLNHGTITYLQGQPTVRKDRIGAVGFCFGGGLTWRLATRNSAIRAAVPFYGPNPPLEDVPQIKAAILAIYGELDNRIDAGIPAIREAMKKTAVPFEVVIYPGADHAFFNDTGQRYHAPSALDAWHRTVAWFDRYLKGS